MPRLLLLALLGLWVAAPAFAQPAVERLLRDADAPFHHTVLGLCEDYPEETTTEAVYRADFELLKETGIDVLRISFGWDGIEEEQDEYDWLFWDDFVETAVDEYGITLIPYVMYTPRWASTNKEDAYFWRSPPEDYDEFAEFVFDLVTRYKDRITSWELWNEPDIEWFWMGTAEEFAPFLAAGAEAVRRADPEATIVFGGLAHDTDFLLTLFRDHGASEHVDVVNMHNYNETWSADPVEDIGAYIRRVSEIIARYGDGQPLWMAEVGYSTYRDGAYVSGENLAYYAYEHTPAFQAVQLVRTVTAALATDKLAALAWYEIKDLPPTDEVIGDTNNRSLGIADNDHTLKPAAHALAFANRFYGEPMRSLDQEVIVPRAPDSDVVVHAFEQEDGDVLLAAWLQTRRVAEQDDVGDGTHEDTRRRSVEVIVPRDLAGAATRYDELGTEASHDGVRREDGRTVVPLALEGGQIVLVHLAH